MKSCIHSTSIIHNNKNHTHSIIYDYENGEKICSMCGIVIKDKINDAELETATYKNTNNTNTALPYSLTLYDQGISTVIADSYRYNANESINKKTHHKMEFLNKIVSYSNEKRNLKIAIDVLNRLKDKLSLTYACIEEAFSYYKKALDSGLIKGRSIKEMMIACIYITCKKINLPRTLPELSKIVNGNEIFAARCYRILSREFKITFVPSDPAMFLHKIASESQISEITAHKALDILISVRKNEKFVGKDSLSVAAAVLYTVCKKEKEKVSQSRIAQSANINIITLRKRLLDIKDIELDQ
ncbi:MAG TPA: TFIIB-type zinc ribbon-containing protein [Candidatus Nitrosocosmicus sp.]